MTQVSERQRVEQIRARVAALGGADWSLAADGDGMLLESVAPEIGASGTARVTLARFGEHATGEEMELAARAPADLTFLIGLFDRAVKALRPPPAKPAKNHAAEAAIKAGDWYFQRFLAERHQLLPPLTAERATQRLRSVLGVTSRKELNVSGSVAAARWVRLRDEFEAWRREN